MPKSVCQFPKANSGTPLSASQTVARERIRIQAMVKGLECQLGKPETDSDELLETIVVLCHRLNNLTQRQMMLEAVGQ